MKSRVGVSFLESSDGVYFARNSGIRVFFVVRLKLVELLEANHGSNFSECSSRDVEAVLSDETRSAASDSALSET